MFDVSVVFLGINKCEIVTGNFVLIGIDAEMACFDILIRIKIGLCMDWILLLS